MRRVEVSGRCMASAQNITPCGWRGKLPGGEERSHMATGIRKRMNDGRSNDPHYRLPRDLLRFLAV